MYPVPIPTVPGQPTLKPVLQGVRNKQRKGVQKANAKHEPVQFRDSLVKHLESVNPVDYDALASKLDVLGNQLDYRKYEQELFEILITGALLAPGGGLADDGTPRSSFSLLGSAKEPVEVSDIKKIVDVFNKLLRRYKYLQKPFEENALKGILQYANKFTPADQEKLAIASAIFVSISLASASVLSSLKKEHLVKDSTALTFLTSFLRAYLAVESLDHLSNSLKKGGAADLAEFFPVAKRSKEEMTNWFKKENIVGVMEFYTKQKNGAAKEETLYRLKELVADESDNDEILSYLESIARHAIIPEAEFIVLVWNGLMTALDMTAKPEQINDIVIKEISRIADILEVFCTKPTTEVVLINTIQVWSYENTKIMPAFPKILKVLYSRDVLSEQAIIYWHSKGSKVEARQHFLKVSEPLVAFLKEQEEEESEEE